MHEYPVTLRIVKIACREAEKAHGRAAGITLVVGDDSGFVGESIQMYFDVIAKGTPCEGARLTIERVVPKLKCSACGALFERKPFSFACPVCGGEGTPTEIGREFYVKSVEVEVPDSCT